VVENAENIMRDLGFSNLRVRLHGKIARIELIHEELKKAVNLRHRIVELLQDCGFSYITLDLKGYRAAVWMKYYECIRCFSVDEVL
jgi:pyridinium-3,5-biscarboxylic acid mononucleotide sulfurtransferase